MPRSRTSAKLRAQMPDESPIDLDEHARRIAAVVDMGRQVRLPPPGARPDLVEELRPARRLKSVS